MRALAGEHDDKIPLTQNFFTREPVRPALVLDRDRDHHPDRGSGATVDLSGLLDVHLAYRGLHGFRAAGWMVAPPALAHLGFADGHSELHRWVDKRTIQLAAEKDWDVVRLTRDNQAGNEDITFMKNHHPRRGVDR